ncbi:TlpA family protein disulfide reductase [Methanoregula sp.]|uniref:TlpA family protein disulfide reductase n=1 Tax=Methanoregula sp. TaxID=2052170 RepID=UPI003568C843
MDKIIKISVGLFAVIIFCAALVFVYPAASPGQSSQGSTGIGPGGNVTVYYFYGKECPHCHKIMPFVQSLQQKYPAADILFLETWHNQTNYILYTQVNQDLGVRYAAVPEAVVGDVVLIGEKDIPEKLEQAIIDQLKKKR